MKKTIKCIAITVILGLILNIYAVSLWAQDIKEEKTASGIPYSQIEQTVSKYIKEREAGLASVAVGIFDGGETIIEAWYGESDSLQHIKANEETVYEWGSTSKLLVWVSVMQLEERGLLDLNEDIRAYLPEKFLNKSSFDDSPITMLNLMNHNAGFQEMVWTCDEDLSLEETLKKTQPIRIKRPGAVTAYSNWATGLAAFIVEQVSGEDYITYVTKNILSKLMMTHTSVGPNCQDNEWVKNKRKELKCYLKTVDLFEDYGNAYSRISPYPAGAATGTLSEFMTFAKAFVTESEACPLFKEKDTLKRMLEATSYYGKEGEQDIERNCHGMLVFQMGVPVKGHTGNTEGCTSMLVIEPKIGLGVVVMTNEVGETPFCYGIPQLLFGTYKGEGTPITQTPDISGIYCAYRGYSKGYIAKLYNTVGQMMPISKTASQVEFKVGTFLSLRQISNQVYLQDDGNGASIMIVATRDQKGNIILQNLESDYTIQLYYWLQVIMVLLMLIAFLSAVIIAIWQSMKLIIVQVRRVTVQGLDHKLSSYNRRAIILIIAFAVLFIFNFYIPIFETAIIDKQSTVVRCLLILIGTVVLLLNMIKSIIYYNKQRKITDKSCKLAKRQLRLSLVCIILSSATVLSMCYFQQFNFWACW